jgi:hypothetical protein
LKQLLEKPALKPSLAKCSLGKPREYIIRAGGKKFKKTEWGLFFFITPGELLPYLSRSPYPPQLEIVANPPTPLRGNQTKVISGGDWWPWVPSLYFLRFFIDRFHELK